MSDANGKSVERSNVLAESVEPEEVLVKGAIEPSPTKWLWRPPRKRSPIQTTTRDTRSGTTPDTPLPLGPACRVTRLEHYRCERSGPWHVY